MSHAVSFHINESINNLGTAVNYKERAFSGTFRNTSQICVQLPLFLVYGSSALRQEAGMISKDTA